MHRHHAWRSISHSTCWCSGWFCGRSSHSRPRAQSSERRCNVFVLPGWTILISRCKKVVNVTQRCKDRQKQTQPLKSNLCHLAHDSWILNNLPQSLNIFYIFSMIHVRFLFSFSSKAMFLLLRQRDCLPEQGPSMPQLLGSKVVAEIQTLKQIWIGQSKLNRINYFVVFYAIFL